VAVDEPQAPAMIANVARPARALNLERIVLLLLRPDKVVARQRVI
jgi:hypothetical protein